MTSVTLKTFPEMPVASAAVLIGAAPDSEAFWNFTTYIVSQSPRLQEFGVMGYCYVAPQFPYNGSVVGGYTGVLSLPNGTLAELEKATAPLQDYIGSIPGVQMSIFPTQYHSVFAYYEAIKNVAPVGNNIAVGNRLLDKEALANITALRIAMKKGTPAGSIGNLNLIAGPGLWAAKPAGGSDSVTPAWRKTYVEYGAIFAHPSLIVHTDVSQQSQHSGHIATGPPKIFKHICSQMYIWKPCESSLQILARI